MIIRFSFKDIEDMIKNKLPMMGVDASFHWNPDNKDFDKESVASYDIILEVNGPSFQYMQLTLYKLNQLVKGYPIISYIIDHVEIVQQGQGEHTTIVKIVYKQFCNEIRNFLDK